MASPFLFQKPRESAVWLYNSRLGTAIILSIIASIIFGGGLYAITSSLDFLLGVDVNRDVYDVVWIVAIGFIGPVFGLYLMPENSHEELVLPDQNALLARGVSFLINFVLTPMLVIYIVILHLYAAKILFTFSLPKGQVALMVLIFSLGLTGFIIFARPWAERSTRLTKWLLNYWHLLLFTPLILLAISVARRISDYGITPERYMLVVLGLWLVALLVLPLIKRAQISSVQILGSIAAILIIVSFGPWGAKSVSIYSQKQRFVELLERNGLIEDNVLVANLTSAPKMSAEDAKTGHSITRFLSRNHGLESIRPIFNGHPDDPFNLVDNSENKWGINNEIIKLLGLSPNAAPKNNSVAYSVIKQKPINIDKYSAYVPRLSLRNHLGRPLSERVATETRLWRKDDFVFVETSRGTFKGNALEIIELVKKANKKITLPKNRTVLSFELTSETGKADMLIHSMNAEFNGDKLGYVFINFDLLIE